MTETRKAIILMLTDAGLTNNQYGALLGIIDTDDARFLQTYTDGTDDGIYLPGKPEDYLGD